MTDRSIVLEGLTLALLDGDNDQPRMRDLDLARELGFGRPRDVRQLIERYETAGILNDIRVCGTVPQTPGGRPGREYWLTEEQALFIVAKSETPKATAMLQVVIRVFMLARRGLLPSVGGSPEILAAVAAARAEARDLITELQVTIDGQAAQLAALAANVPRKEITQKTKDRHELVLKRLNGYCPCCWHVLLIVDGKLQGHEWDHFYARNRNKLHEVWAICETCHRKRSAATSASGERARLFHAYQELVDEKLARELAADREAKAAKERAREDARIREMTLARQTNFSFEASV